MKDGRQDDRVVQRQRDGDEDSQGAHARVPVVLRRAEAALRLPGAERQRRGIHRARQPPVVLPPSRGRRVRRCLRRIVEHLSVYGTRLRPAIWALSKYSCEGGGVQRRPSAHRSGGSTALAAAPHGGARRTAAAGVTQQQTWTRSGAMRVAPGRRAQAHGSTGPARPCSPLLARSRPRRRASMAPRTCSPRNRRALRLKCGKEAGNENVNSVVAALTLPAPSSPSAVRSGRATWPGFV